MKSKGLMVVGIMAVVFFLFSAVALCQAEKEGKGGQKEWSKIIDSKVAEQAGDNAVINYEDGYIEAVGIGAVDLARVKGTNSRPMCLKAAELVAKRNLLEATEGIQIDSQTTVKDFVTESDVINASVRGFVKGSIKVKEDYLSDGTCEVTVRMPLSGKFSQAIMPPRVIQEDMKSEAPLPPLLAAAPKVVGSKVYTGIVVDARGIGARPALSPKIVDESGAEVYGPIIVDKDCVITQGICGYAKDLAAAQRSQRVTDKPLTVKGLSAEGAVKSDIRIGNEDAQKIRSAAETLDAIKKCRVIIVLD